MQRIINSKVKKSRARRQAWERWKIKRYSKKVIKHIVKQYKKTGETTILLDMYKFNEEKLIKVLEMLASEKQISFEKQDDLYTILLIMNEVKSNNKSTDKEKKQAKDIENKPVKNQMNVEDYKPF